MKLIARSLPSTFQVVLALLASLVLVGLSNVRFLVTFLGFSQDSQYLMSSFSLFWSRAFSGLDRLSFAPATALFLFWGLVGIAVLTLVNAVHNTFASLSFDIQVSRSFWHPRTFSQFAFWRGVVINFAAEIFGLFVLLAAVWVLLFLSLPFSILTTHVFIAKPLSLTNVGYLLSGAVAIWLTLLIGISSFNVFIRMKARVEA